MNETNVRNNPWTFVFALSGCVCLTETTHKVEHSSFMGRRINRRRAVFRTNDRTDGQTDRQTARQADRWMERDRENE